jgi:hypothetical protein
MRLQGRISGFEHCDGVFNSAFTEVYGDTMPRATKTGLGWTI